jgi:hypothetical protein
MLTSRSASLLLVLVFALVAVGGCSARAPEAAVPVPGPPAVDAEPPESEPEPDPRTGELTELRDRLTAIEAENGKLRRDLEQQNGARTALEEENASLELELAIALDEILRIQANLKNVKSRAFAVSRIAEVRVELESLRGRDDVALADRLDRADRFLQRADKALGDDNVGGATFLAERAGELVRQSKTIAEVRHRQSRELLPIVPPREIEVRAAANLRSGPRSDSERVGAVVAGTRLLAVARLGDWFQVRSDDGKDVWIHRGLVQ